MSAPSTPSSVAENTKTRPSSGFVPVLFSVVVSVLAITANYIWSRHWKGAKVTPLEWNQDANYTLVEVPTTFYELGKLSTILSEVRPYLNFAQLF